VLATGDVVKAVELGPHRKQRLVEPPRLELDREVGAFSYAASWTLLAAEPHDPARQCREIVDERLEQRELGLGPADPGADGDKHGANRF
jgi:hypothetical protein